MRKTIPKSEVSRSAVSGTPAFALLAGAVAVLTIVAYANSFGAGLILDSRAIIGDDPRVHTTSADTLAYIFTRDYWWPAYESGLYRPVTTFSYWVNATLLGAGTEPWPFHATNLALHLANAVLVMTLVGRFSGDRRVGLAAAAIFAVHPLNTEAVTNVVGRADLLAALAVLGGVWCHVRGIASSTPVRWRLGLAAFAILGVFSKENAVLLFVAVPLHDLIWRWPALPGATTLARARSALRAWWPEYAVLAHALVTMLAVRSLVRSAGGPVHAYVFVDNPIALVGGFEGWMTAWKVLARAFALLVFPKSLSSDYSYDAIPLYGSAQSPAGDIAAWLAIALVCGMLVTAWRLRRSQPAVSWTLVFIPLALLPTSNLIVRTGSVFGERFCYLATIGAATLAATLLVARTRPRIHVPLIAATLLFFSARTALRNADWRDDLSLAQSAVAAMPNSFKNLRGLAGALLARSNDEATLDSAIVLQTRALAILDARPLPLEWQEPGVLLNLGVYHRQKAHYHRQRRDTAAVVAALARSVEYLSRARGIAARTGAGELAVLLELGDSYLEAGDWPRAWQASLDAQRLDPSNARAYLIAATARFYERRPDEAAPLIAMAILSDPARTDAWENLAATFAAMGLQNPITTQRGVRRFDLTNTAVTSLFEVSAHALLSRIAEHHRAAGGPPRDSARQAFAYRRDSAALTSRWERELGVTLAVQGR